MAAQKFAADFESLVNAQDAQVGNWADLSDCEQLDYGVVKAQGTISGGEMRLICRRDENHPPMVIITLDASTLTAIDGIGFQASETRPHGKQFAWEITTPIVGGYVTATINGRHKAS